MTDAATWFAERTTGAPPRLRASAAAFLAQVTSGGDVASQFREAAMLALRAVLGQEKSRATALALLTADSLVTLALLAQVEMAPADLERFAAGIMGAEAA